MKLLPPHSLRAKFREIERRNTVGKNVGSSVESAGPRVTIAMADEHCSRTRALRASLAPPATVSAPTGMVPWPVHWPPRPPICLCFRDRFRNSLTKDRAARLTDVGGQCSRAIIL
jgi:hypothetical protein